MSENNQNPTHEIFKIAMDLFNEREKEEIYKREKNKFYDLFFKRTNYSRYNYKLRFTVF
jgi:hypothetical protein